MPVRRPPIGLPPPSYEVAVTRDRRISHGLVGGTTYLNLIVNRPADLNIVCTCLPSRPQTLMTGNAQRHTGSPRPYQTSHQPPFPKLLVLAPHGAKFWNLAHSFDKDYEELQSLVGRAHTLSANLQLTAQEMFALEALWRRSGRSDLASRFGSVFNVGKLPLSPSPQAPVS
jgi:hypothetical protein